MAMFCYQCEQTAQGKACTVAGACGKSPDVAALQDLLTHVARGIAQYAHRASELGVRDAEVDRFVVEALFTTVTNVNFDAERMAGMVRQGLTMRDRARETYERAGGARQSAGGTGEPGGDAVLRVAGDLAGMVAQGQVLSILDRLNRYGPDIAGLQELVTYGLKGMAAYAHHARVLGLEDPGIYAFFHEALSYLAADPADAAGLTDMALRVGAVNLRVIQLLDEANTSAYGHPEPTRVRVTPVPGKAILVSGHDLKDLKMLLEQTEGTGINVYTHGEMLPALAYPELKRHRHLAGNYGGAWQDQRREFAAFPGAILMTTNCIQRPAETYSDRIFTTGLVAWPGVRHIAADPAGRKDFRPVIEAALGADGFGDEVKGQPEKTITIGFARNAVLGVADAVVEAIRAGKIRRFFLIAGCDGAKPGRNYYTELAQALPDDCVILTLACGKYRFNKLEFGETAGIPRLLDMGQCNDAYSAVQVASALAAALGCGIHDLPLSLVLSWYEQKAVAILLTLLHLGIKDIRLGPSLPAFVGPGVLKVLRERFGLRPVATVAEDLREMLGE